MSVLLSFCHETTSNFLTPSWIIVVCPFNDPWSTNRHTKQTVIEMTLFNLIHLQIWYGCNPRGYPSHNSHEWSLLNSTAVACMTYTDIGYCRLKLHCMCVCVCAFVSVVDFTFCTVSYSCLGMIVLQSTWCQFKHTELWSAHIAENLTVTVQQLQGYI